MWFDIETAPKTGERIILAYVLSLPEDDHRLVPTEASCGWWSCDKWHDDLLNTSLQPTHWQPMPDVGEILR